MFDVLLQSARVFDGTGNPWYRADVALRGDTIAAIGKPSGGARRVIDARRLALCPGFVDIHTHPEGVVEHPAAANVLRQGVTTVVAGNCGASPLPVGPWLDRVAAARPAVNVATYVGHGTVRRRILGDARRKPTAGELRRMCHLVEQAMRHGAVGLSTGLFYVPGAYARLPELVELSRAAAAFGGIYASHKRSAGGRLFEALREAATIGRRAKIPIEISHLKVLHRRGRTRKDRAARVLETIGRYRDDGVEITCDVHPYPASNTALAAVAIPPRIARGGRLIERLQDAAVRRRIRDEVAGNIAWMGGADRIVLTDFRPDRSLAGRSLAEIARMRRRGAAETAMDLVVEAHPQAIFHNMRVEDVRRIVCSEFVMIASDGGVVPRRRGVVHPRNYGTFPRVLREYVRDLGVLRLEEAIRRMTAMPARKVGLRDRGLIAVGMKADLVLFDPDRIADRATFQAPHAFPTGIRCVLVNGHVAWDGRRIAARAGRAIRRQ
jgi:N-acyl-D-aspartate/D-glutamate deacylase